MNWVFISLQEVFKCEYEMGSCLLMPPHEFIDPQKIFVFFQCKKLSVVEKSKVKNNVIVSVIVLERVYLRGDQFFGSDEMFLRLRLFMQRK